MTKRSNRPVSLNSTQHGMRPCTVYQRTSKYLKNAHTQGFNKYKASPGDMIVWRTSETDTRIGRVLGLVDSPAYDERSAIKGHLFVLLLSEDCSHTYPVWVDPDDVIVCRESPTKLAAFFFGATLNEMPVEDIVKAARRGTLSDLYIHKLGDES